MSLAVSALPPGFYIRGVRLNNASVSKCPVRQLTRYRQNIGGLQDYWYR